MRENTNHPSIVKYQKLNRIVEPSDNAFNVTLNGVMNNDGTHPNVAWKNTVGGVLINMGDTFKFASSSADGTFTRPDGVYNMVQFHIHSNSEHRVNGRTYAAEFHCKELKLKIIVVHTRTTINGTSLAVVGAFVDFGDVSDAFTSAFVNVLSLI